MTKKIKIKPMKKLAAVLLNFIIIYNAQADKKESQSGKTSFDISIDAGTKITIFGDKDVIIEEGSKGIIELEVIANFKGDENEEVLNFINNLEQEVRSKITRDQHDLIINTNPNEPNKVRKETRFFGFVTYYFYEKLELNYKLKIPRSNPIYINTSYNDVRMTGSFKKVSMELNSVGFRASDIEEIVVNAKYGDIKIGSVKNAKIGLYENDLKAKNISKGTIESRYSDISIENSENINLNCYEGNLEIQFARELRGTTKYTDIEIEEEIKNLYLKSAYEGKIELAKIDELKVLSSRYVDYEIGTVKVIDFTDSYEDDLSIEKADKINFKGKYNKIDLGVLNGSFTGDFYEGEIDIQTTGPGASELDFKGTYVKVIMEILNQPFKINANLNYGSLSVPREIAYARKDYSKEGAKINASYRTKDFQENSLNLNFNGYEMDIDLVISGM